MLQELCSVASPGLLIVTDSASISARTLLHSLIVAAIQRGELVHLFSFEFPAEEFLAGIPGNISGRLLRHDGFGDPLCWGGGICRSLGPRDFSARRIRELLEGSLGPISVFLDSLSWIVGHRPLSSVCRTLRDISPTYTPDGSPQMRLVTLLHSDLHGRGVVQSLCSLADWVMDVSAGRDAQLVSIVQRKKSGKVITSTEHVRVLEDHSLQIITESQLESSSRAEVDPAENLTFNLHLSEVERERREAANLPYTFSDTKKLSLLRSAAGSAKIFYDPEPSDDLDQEDPDDDLDV